MTAPPVLSRSPRRRIPRTARGALLLALAGAGLALPACRAPGRGQETAPPPNSKAAALRENLETYVRWLASRVEIAASEIEDQATSTPQRRNAVLWKMRMITEARVALQRNDPTVVLLNLSLLCARVGHFLDQEENATYLGDLTPIARKTCTELAEPLRGFASDILPPDQLAQAEREIERFVAQGGGFSYHAQPGEGVRWSGVVSNVLNMPLDAVQRSFGGVDPTAGLSDTARAVKEASATVDAVRRDLNYLPDVLRWQIELVLCDLDQDPLVSDAVKSFAQVSESSSKLAATADALPAQISTEVTRAMGDLAERQEGLRETLGEVRTTLQSVDETLKGAQGTLETTEATAAAVTTLSGSLTDLTREVDRFLAGFEKPAEEGAPAPAPASTAPAEPARPFDIDDYRRTAESLTETTKALDGLLQRVEDLAAPERASELTAATRAAVRGTVLEVVLGGAALAVLVAAVTLGYRVAARRLGGA